MKKIIRKSFVFQILILFILFNFVSVISFSFYIFYNNRYQAVKKVEATLMEIVKGKDQLITLTMKQIEHEAENLALWTEHYLYEEMESQMSDEYYFSDLGVLTRKSIGNANVRSSVFYPHNQPFDVEIASMVMGTEKLETQFQRISNHIPAISWIATPMENGFLRVFPFSDMTVYAPDHMQRDDPFYKAALKDNIANEVRWSKPYLDLMGTGWVITCTHPIMVNNQVVGIVSLDVNLITLQEEFMKDFRLGESGISHILYKNGDIIYHPEVTPFAENRGDILSTNILKDTEFDNNYKTALENVIQEKEGIITYKDGADKKIIAFSSIEHVSWIVAIEVSQSELISMYPISIQVFIFLMVSSITMILFFVFFFLRYYSRPMFQLVKRAEQISNGDFSYGTANFTHHEIEELWDAFNYMSFNIKNNIAERVLLEKELSLKEKMAGIGQISSSIAHELKTPISTIKGSVYLLESYTRHMDNRKIKNQLDIIIDTLFEAEKIIINLLDFSRISKMDKMDIDIEKLIGQIIFISRKESSRINVKIHTHYSVTPLMYYGSVEPIKQILLNLFTNALNALQHGGNLFISGNIATKDLKTVLEITVEDDGTGIDEAIIDSVFEPFITSQKNEQGTGLGLWITRRLLEKMQGEIHISSKKDIGTKVTIYLPVSEKDQHKGESYYEN